MNTKRKKRKRNYTNSISNNNNIILILAGITINALSGENGILKKSNTSKK